MIFWLMCAPTLGYGEVVVESSQGSADTPALAQLLREQIAAASDRVRSLDTRVTVGAAALRAALSTEEQRPIVAAYLTSTEFGAALAEHPHARDVTAVFSNPDPLDQWAVARSILGRARIAVFDSPGVHTLISRLASQGVTAIPVVPGESVDALIRDVDAADVIIVLPDPTVFNRTNIGHVVRTLYQQRKVLVGYSDTLTQVGSLASVYPATDAIARAVQDVLEKYAEHRALPRPLFVPDVEISLNERLARSLNIVLPNKLKLLEAVRTRRGAPQ
jgi:hypothetical protein